VSNLTSQLDLLPFTLRTSGGRPPSLRLRLWKRRVKTAEIENEEKDGDKR